MRYGQFLLSFINLERGGFGDIPKKRYELRENIKFPSLVGHLKYSKMFPPFFLRVPTRGFKIRSAIYILSNTFKVATYSRSYSLYYIITSFYMLVQRQNS